MLLTKLAKHVLLPLYYYKTQNNCLKRWLELEKSQYLGAEEIEMKQFLALKKLLNHCYDNVPFYRERFDSVGFDPAGFTNISELNCIPYLTKEDLQNNLPFLVAKNFNKESLIADSSGGSTGKPTNFFKDLRRVQNGTADKFRHDRWSGWDLGEKSVKLWGAQREFETQLSLKYQLVEKYVFRIFGFNAFDISENKVLEYVGRLEKIKPTMILAYANVAYLFAKIIESRGIDLQHLGIKGVICSAETLTEDKRATIESAFCCKVLNRYGSREVGLVASECQEQNGLHINMDSVHVEIERGGMATVPDEPGEIIVTDLWNYAMPFIRYQTGDVGTKSLQLCECGRNLPTIKNIEGRVSDFLIDSKGGLVHGEYFTHLFYGLKGIEQFQLIQETIVNIRLRILPGKDFTLTSLDPVIEKIKQCLGEDVIVDIEISESSFVEASGKFRFTISKISNGFFKNSA